MNVANRSGTKLPVVALTLLTLVSSGLVIHLLARNTSHQGEPLNTVTSTPTPCPTSDDFPNVIDDKFISKFNGDRLPLEFDYFPDPEDKRSEISNAVVVPLSDGGLLVNNGSGLVRLDSKRRMVWTYDRTMVFDFTYVESNHLIYGIAMDNIMFILDAATGNQQFIEERNGSAAYGMTEKYGEDMCLVTDNFGIYRERGRAAGIEPMKDGISCWRGTTRLWHQDFPPDADLIVNGNQILAVTRSTKGIYVQEIIPPAGL